MTTINYTVNTDTGAVVADAVTTGTVTTEPVTFQEDGECGNLATAPGASLNQAARECAARRGWALPNGSFPIRSKEMHGAEDLNNAIRAVGRGGTEHNTIRRHIIKRARSLGLSDEIPENWNSDGSIDEGGDSSSAVPATFQDEEECPEGRVRNEDGECVEPDDDNDDGGARTTPSRRNYDTVTAAGPVQPPRAWFDNPDLIRRTPLGVDEDGRVSGHLASWDECHLGIGNRCVTAPHSATGYAYFLTGEVFCSDGSKLPVGKITLGTGHADPSLGFIPAAEHYDNTGSVVAVVNAGEDRFGVWVAGGLVPGVDEQRVAELRRSPLSGDWRRIGGNLELVAALAVNSPGFPVLRASATDENELETLVAAGVVTEPGKVDINQERASRWRKVEDVVRNERVKKLLGE